MPRCCRYVAGSCRSTVGEQHDDLATRLRSRRVDLPQRSARQRHQSFRNLATRAPNRSLLHSTLRRPGSWLPRRPSRTTAPSSRRGCATRPQTPRRLRSPTAGRSSIRCGRPRDRSPCPASTTIAPEGHPGRQPHLRRVRSRAHRGWRRRRGHHRRAGSAACVTGPHRAAWRARAWRGRGTAVRRAAGRVRAASDRLHP